MNCRLEIRNHGGIRRNGLLIANHGLRNPSAVAFLCCLFALFPCRALAQSQSAGAAPEGVENGNYFYQGSFDFGYRFVDVNGNQGVYDTYVNYQQGPRLLDQTFNMRSLNNQGMLFDHLYLDSFGWGGDPENASHFRLDKNKWYNFSSSFRRDQNFWDYNLLANPLNPPNTFIQVNNSPHTMHTTRRMYDYNLTVLPESRVRFRLDYARNNMEGPAFSTIHGGTDTMLFQNTRTLLDSYQIGVDFKVLPRTSISYDQFLQYYRGDTSWGGQTPGFQLSNGTPVDAGIVYNAPAGQPCSNTPTPIFGPGTPPVLRATCNGYLGYSRSAPVRTSYPVEQVTIQSNYIKRLDFSGRVSYSSAYMKAGTLLEQFAGLVTRTGQQAFIVTGNSQASRVVTNVDAGATYHVTNKLRISDSFRFANFRIPGNSSQVTVSLFGGTAPPSMLNPIVPYNPTLCPPTCPSHGAGAPADLSNNLFSRFLGQDAKYNTIQVEYDFTRSFGGHLGYNYGSRSITETIFAFATETFDPSNPNRGDCATVALNPDGTCTFSGQTDSGDELIPVHEHSMLFGLWFHPGSKLRATYDMQLMSADNSPTRISPRNLQRYTARIHYRPKDWAVISGSVNGVESRNNVVDILHREHAWDAGFSVMLTPKPKYGVELGYNYSDVFSTTNICYVFGATPPAGSTLCSSGAPFISGVSLYINRVNFGYANLMFQPVKRVTTRVGYNLTSSSGNSTILTPLTSSVPTLGPLGLNFHRPSAAVEVGLSKGFTWRTGWNYYDYNEKSSSFPLPPRDFQSNQATLSLLYEF